MVPVEASSEKDCARNGNQRYTKESEKSCLLFCCWVLSSLAQPRPIFPSDWVLWLDHLTLYDGHWSECLKRMVPEELDSKPVFQVSDGQGLHLWGSKTRDRWLARGIFGFEGLDGRGAGGEGEGGIL